MGTSAASGPLNLFIIVIFMLYDLPKVFSSPPIENSALTTLWIYLIIYLIDISHIDKICD